MQPALARVRVICREVLAALPRGERRNSVTSCPTPHPVARAVHRRFAAPPQGWWPPLTVHMEQVAVCANLRAEGWAAAEAILCRDPVGAFGRMDAVTQAEYRRALETLSTRIRAPCSELAALALRKAESAAGDPSSPPAAAHVGYYLFEPGVNGLLRGAGSARLEDEGVRELVQRHPAVAHACLTALCVAVLASAAAWYAAASGTGWLLSTVVASLVAITMWAHASETAQYLLSPLVPPRVLPRMAFAGGIPADCRTLVAVPTVFSSPGDASEQVSRLERLAESHPDENLYFALVSDFPDAPDRAAAGDDAILAAAATAVESVNARLCHAGENRFFVLHRERRWNAGEQTWMGWERKRGKMIELHRLLRSSDRGTSFTRVMGDLSVLQDGSPIRYVLSLDEDTWVLPGQITTMIRTAAHPLNRPVFDRATGRVVAGYGILQPQVRPIPPQVVRGAAETRFTRLCSGYFLVGGRRAPAPAGRRQSVGTTRLRGREVFGFDMLGNGQYCGKGLHDVDAVLAALDGVFPDNAVLSHDYLEGYLTRVGVLRDVYAIEPATSRVAAGFAQYHRWLRGDCQATPWLLPRVRDGRGTWARNPVPPESRLRMVGTLLLHARFPAMLALLLLAWFVLPGSPTTWTAIAMAGILFSVLRVWLRAVRAVISSVVLRPAIKAETPAASGEWRLASRLLASHMVERVFTVALLGHQVVLAVDASVRVAWRMCVSKRGLLEWTLQRRVESRRSTNYGSYFRTMWPSTALGLFLLAAVAVLHPTRLPLVAPFAGLWAIAFAIARYVDQPAAARERVSQRL